MRVESINSSNSVESKKTLVFALSMSSFFLLFPASYFSILKINKLSRVIDSGVIDMLIKLFESSTLISAVILFVIVLTTMIMMICPVVFLVFESTTLPSSPFHRLYFFAQKWMMLEVFSVAVFASMFKLAELVETEIMMGTYFVLVLWFILLLISKNLWFEERQQCDNYSDIKVIAYSLTAMALLIPGNILPVMSMSKPGVMDTTNLWDSILHLLEGPSWPIGVVVFLASFIGPWFKIFSLIYLAIANGNGKNVEFKKHLYHFLETIGKWSMIDIFIAAILVAIVQLGSLANVKLEVGGIYFTAMVVFTLMASASFQPRDFDH